MGDHGTGPGPGGPGGPGRCTHTHTHTQEPHCTHCRVSLNSALPGSAPSLRAAGSLCSAGRIGHFLLPADFPLRGALEMGTLALGHQQVLGWKLSSPLSLCCSLVNNCDKNPWVSSLLSTAGREDKYCGTLPAFHEQQFKICR